MSEDTVSVSKGVFIFKNRNICDYKRITKSHLSDTRSSGNVFSDKIWYKSYNNMWKAVDKKIKELNNKMFSSLLGNLVESIKNSYSNPVSEIPTGVLLTGINMPDHSALFSTLLEEVNRKVSPHVAMLNAEDCQSLKHVVESTVNQIVYGTEEEDFITDGKRPRVRKSHCTFEYLKVWYENQYGSLEFKTTSPVKRKPRDGHKLLIVIVPDFEGFDDKIMQTFILILSSYLNVLPFVLVFGVATSLAAVHKALPYHVSSKINVQIFNSHQSTTYLNNIVENVFFSEDCPFHVGGRVFNLFTDNFLFYDLSVKGFVRNFKYAMLEHYSRGNIMALCAKATAVDRIMNLLSASDIEELQSLPSVKNNQADDFRKYALKEITGFFSYLNTFHSFLKCLHLLVQDLPKAPLGKNIRELYCTATSKKVSETEPFRECFQLLGLQSKDELTSKLEKICEFLEKEIDETKSNTKAIKQVLDNLENHIESIEAATQAVEQPQVENTGDLIAGKMDRKQLKEKLLEMSKKTKPLNMYELARSKLITYLQETFEKFLEQPSTKPFYEIFFFDDMAIKRHIVGSHRAAIHNALSNPHCYLQCECCKLEDNGIIKASMPDVCILYKLHLEYTKLINLYDWLQSFLSIVDPNSDVEEERKVKPELHARFTQAVADLEFLGFIKSSTRKADHVVRLTWGG